MPKASSQFQDGPQIPITPVEAYDPAYWRERAEQALKRALDARGEKAAAFYREAADYERLAAYAADIAIASYAA